MKDFIIYDKNGKILRSGKAIDPQIQALDGEFVLETTANARLEMVVDGKVVSRPKEEVESELFLRTILSARKKRNDLLLESDWTQVPDAPVDQAAWATYRQLLRDITAQDNFPFDITWPNPPV